jgi:hypothetical protein
MLTGAAAYGTAHMLYYIAQQLKGCSRARKARLLAPRCPRGSEGQQRAGGKPGCLSCEGRERAKGRERGPLRGYLGARGGAGIGEGQDSAVWAAFAYLPESRPIADQDVTHVNIMRSALARPCAATLHQSARDAAPVSTRHATHGATQSAIV